jgi:hypothetical protein
MKLTACLGWMVAGSVMMSAAMPRVAKAGQADASANAAPQNFHCYVGYAVEECKQQIEVLKAVVEKYPTKALGEWTWVLVKSQDWKPIVKKLGLDANSPAFTCLEKRVTFVEEALVSSVTGQREEELFGTWHVRGANLLDLAVRHEMGHSICNTKAEDKADHIASVLERHAALSCQTALL